MLWAGLAVTLEVGVCAAVVATFMGLLGAWGKLSKSPIARTLANTYTVIVRGVPELVLILLCYYGLTILLQKLLTLVMGQEVLIDINPFLAGVITIGLIYGAFATEVFRGAFQTVPKGQIEAARAYGMHAPMRFRRVIFPQMIRYAIPGMGNQWLNITKDSSLVSLVGATELAFAAKSAAAQTKHYLFFYSVGALCFLAITIVSMVVLHHIERNASRGVRRA